MTAPVDWHRDVEAAAATGRPVVALESTVIAHGLPWPENLETTREMCAALEAAGAVPAVVGIVGGRIRVGLQASEVERFARERGAAKASRRDLPALIASGEDGATTVSGTLVCAHLAGIEVFATGGIGGVHRGGETTLDVSSDLRELGRRPVAVVCSGAKSILDLPRTAEVLETEGVAVVGLRTDTLPAFHCRDSTVAVSTRARSDEEAARMVIANRGLGGGLLLANPIPAGAAIPAATMEQWIVEALNDAAQSSVTGKAVTPFVLARLAQLSGGRTLEANRALLVDNAGAAGRIAVAIARLDRADRL